MPALSPAPESPWRKWLTVGALALLLAYVTGQVAGMAVVFLSDDNGNSTAPVMPLILGAQALALCLGAVLLARIPQVWRRVHKGLRVAGILALVAVVLLAVAVGIQMVDDTSRDQGAATAGFFALLLFGLPLLVQAGLFLFGAALAGRRATAAGG